MINKNVNIIIVLLFFACGNKSNSSEIIADDSYFITTEYSVQREPVTTEEFISFWNKFSDALLKNNIPVLDSLIDDNFYGCYCGYFDFLTIFEICDMNFTIDSVVSKNRFLKEFRNSLNPVYLQLLEQYDVHEDIKPKTPIRTLEEFQSRYRCMKEIGKNRYILGLPQNINGNDKVIFKFHLRIKHSVTYEEIKSIDLIFYKMNDEIKLHEIDFDFSEIEVHPLDLE